MAKFDIDIEGLNDLTNMFNNIRNQADNFDGEILINKNNIVANIDSFNNSFNTSFTSESTDTEFLEYFENQYSDIFQKHFADNINYKDEFNTIFTGFAHVD